jgi:hypothetical protein
MAASAARQGVRWSVREPGPAWVGEEGVVRKGGFIGAFVVRLVEGYDENSKLHTNEPWTGNFACGVTASRANPDAKDPVCRLA